MIEVNLVNEDILVWVIWEVGVKMKSVKRFTWRLKGGGGRRRGEFSDCYVGLIFVRGDGKGGGLGRKSLGFLG